MERRRITPALIVHGGAGKGRSRAELPRYKAEMANALSEGMNTLRRGSAVDAVEAAVRYMEDSAVFNAGRGSILTLDGRMQLDAAIMSGRGLRAGAVGACTCTLNPIRLARYVMERTPHVLIVGEDCRPLAKEAGISIETPNPTKDVAARYLKLEKSRFGRTGTVGAVAIDREGSPASAVSTGGTWMKLPGRVGDSAVIGAGVYADRTTGAACATGVGEEIMRNSLSWEACRLMHRFDAVTAARLSVASVTRRSGSGRVGLITVDTKGRTGFAYNTKMMGRAWFDTERGRTVVEI